MLKLIICARQQIKALCSWNKLIKFFSYPDVFVYWVYIFALVLFFYCICCVLDVCCVYYNAFALIALSDVSIQTEEAIELKQYNELMTEKDSKSKSREREKQKIIKTEIYGNLHNSNIKSTMDASDYTRYGDYRCGLVFDIWIVVDSHVCGYSLTLSW